MLVFRFLSEVSLSLLSGGSRTAPTQKLLHNFLDMNVMLLVWAFREEYIRKLDKWSAAFSEWVGRFQGMGRQLNKMTRHPFEMGPAATGNDSGSQLA